MLHCSIMLANSALTMSPSRDQKQPMRPTRLHFDIRRLCRQADSPLDGPNVLGEQSEQRSVLLSRLSYSTSSRCYPDSRVGQPSTTDTHKSPLPIAQVLHDFGAVRVPPACA